MFNLLMSANNKAWDTGVWQLDRDRFLEYTDGEYKTRFSSLSDQVVKELKAMPCLFAYEAGTEKPYRMGRITEIRADSRLVRVSFSLYPNYLATPKQFNRLAPKLGVTDDWEFNRTHWAVKSADLLEVGLFDAGGGNVYVGDRVFIVHGHDHKLKEEVEALITAFGLEPVVLHREANKGRTIIEKFEQSADVGFAVVLLTADDAVEAGSRRARQNVILELGYFIGKLGRQRVCALNKGSVEIPSDILGVVFTAVKRDGKWREELYRELQAADYSLRPFDFGGGA